MEALDDANYVMIESFGTAQHISLGAALLLEHRTSRGECGVEIDDSVQLLDADVDELGGIGGARRGVGDDDGDGVADVAHDVEVRQVSFALSQLVMRAVRKLIRGAGARHDRAVGQLAAFVLQGRLHRGTHVGGEEGPVGVLPLV